MIVIPAVDVRGGRCVRLVQGDFGAETRYSDDPLEQAQSFAREGARRVHVIDLDRARGREDPASTSAVRSICQELSGAGVEVEVGGGIRTAAAAESALRDGAAYVVLGSVAARQPRHALGICEAFPGAVLLGLDVRGDVAQAQGWTEPVRNASELIRLWRDWPAAGLIRTDVLRDGTLRGPDLDGLRACIEEFQGPVIASGGIGGLDDLRACESAGAAAAVVGRALYEGRLDLGEALRSHPSVPASP